MQAKHLWYNLDIRWVDLEEKLEVLAPTGLTKNDIWRRSHPPCIDLATALHGFGIDNTAAQHAIEESKALHARRWQTKDGIYRIKRQALPDVRDAPLDDDNAAASSTNAKPRWRNWDEDYAMGYQRHP